MTVVTMFSKQGCMFCDKARSMLKDYGIDFDEIDVTNDPYYKATLNSFGVSVPRIWCDGTFVGGHLQLENYIWEQGLAEL